LLSVESLNPGPVHLHPAACSSRSKSSLLLPYSLLPSLSFPHAHDIRDQSKHQVSGDTSAFRLLGLSADLDTHGVGSSSCPVTSKMSSLTDLLSAGHHNHIPVPQTHAALAHDAQSALLQQPQLRHQDGKEWWLTWSSKVPWLYQPLFRLTPFHSKRVLSSFQYTTDNTHDIQSDTSSRYHSASHLL